MSFKSIQVNSTAKTPVVVMKENIVFILIVLVIFSFGFAFGIVFQEPVASEENEECIEEVKNIPFENYNIFSEVKTKLVAVDSEGNGVVTNLTVRAVPGNGRVLVDVESLLFWIDTQQSIQTAKEVAENYIGEESKNLDLTYTIGIPNTTLVGGPSAGAAFTIATIAALENKTLRNDTVITGTIEPDGKIGKVGGIIAKGKAVKDSGYKYFLIPKGQGEYIEYKKIQSCEKHGYLKVCSINYEPVEIDVEEELGIDVIEVPTINDAVKYFLE